MWLGQPPNRNSPSFQIYFAAHFTGLFPNFSELIWALWFEPTLLSQTRCLLLPLICNLLRPFSSAGERGAFNAVRWLIAVAAPLGIFDDCPIAVIILRSDLAPYSYRYHDLRELLVRINLNYLKVLLLMWIICCLYVRTPISPNYWSLCIRLMYPNGPWLDYLYVSVFTLLSHGCYALLFCLLWVMVGFAQWFYWVHFIPWVVYACWVFNAFFLPGMLINSRTLQSSSPNPAYFASLLHLRRMSSVPSPYPQLTFVGTDSLAPSYHANLLNSSQLPYDGPSPTSQLLTELDGSSHHNPSSKDMETTPTFSWVVKLGMGSLGGHSLPRTRLEHHVYPIESHLESKNKVISSGVTPPDFDLPTMRLFGKICGDSIPFHLIRIKTKCDWTQVKGQIDYVDMGNGWILFKFTTVPGREYVWLNQPWFVSRLNVVLKPWVPMFDPYAVSDTHVDQWITITRLPQEY